jgi:hypothetical protein
MLGAINGAEFFWIANELQGVPMFDCLAASAAGDVGVHHTGVRRAPAM